MDYLAETIRLYDHDPYEKEFDAKVVKCISNSRGHFVILDSTLFFPEQGGQECDTGSLNSYFVKDVQIRNGYILHEMDIPMEVGTRVHGIINWKHRYSNMQQHTGEHLFSGLVHSLFGYDNVGFHLSKHIVTMDYNGELTSEDIKKLETLTNRAIWENVYVNGFYPTPDALRAMTFRSKLDLSDRVRIVRIDGYDTCACCAPHVKYTGELGVFKIISFRRYKGGTRLSMLCGDRALEDYRSKKEREDTISSLLSVPAEETAVSVKKLQDDYQALKNQWKNLKVEQLLLKFASLHREHNFLMEEEVDMDVMRRVINRVITSKQGYCGIFCKQEQGYQYLIGSADKDCTLLLRTIQSQGGKGGGSARMIQGFASQFPLSEYLSLIF